MKRWVLGIPALLLLAACADSILAPVQQQDSGQAAFGVAAGSVDSQAGTSADVGSTGAIVLDFEDLATSGADYTYVAAYSRDGFTLTSPSCVASASCTDDEAFAAPQPDNALYEGSTALLNNMPDGVTLLTKDDGGTFTVASIDIAEFQPSNLTPREVSFTGTRADGSTATATFTTDGLAGFETFTFQGFTDLVSLSWVQAYPYHQFDNITLDPVAFEPQTADGPQTKQDCMNGGWEALGFRNQGQCVRMVETGKDSR